MAQPKQKKLPIADPLGPPTTVRFTKSSYRRIRTASNKLFWSEADTIRLLTDIGLEHLQRIKYDLASAIVDRAAASGITAPASNQTA